MNMHVSNPNARLAQDWLAHAQGCRRRAHEYKRWALQDKAAGRLERYRYHRRCAERSWHWAKLAIADAKLHRSLLVMAAQREN